MRRVDEEADRDRGIEVSRDAHRRRDHEREDQAVRERDVRRSERCSDIAARHDRAAADEHQGEDADELGDEVTPGVSHWWDRGSWMRDGDARVRGHSADAAQLVNRPAHRHASDPVVPLQHQRRVDPAEAEAVAQRVLHVGVAARARDVVQVAARRPARRG